MSRNILVIILIALLTAGCTEYSQGRKSEKNSTLLEEIARLTQDNRTYKEAVTTEQVERCRQAILLAQSIEDRDSELQCLIHLLQLQTAQESFNEALQTGSIAFTLAEEQNDEAALGKIYALYGRIYYHISSFDEAFINLEKALTIFQKQNDTVNQQEVLNMQGNIFFNWREYEKAYSYYNRNLELSTFRNDNLNIAKALTNIGVIYASRATLKSIPPDSINILNTSSIQNMRNALLFIQKTDYTVVHAEILNNMAQIYDQCEAYDSAIRKATEAQLLVKGISDRVYTASGTTYARTLLTCDSLEKAESITLEMLALAKERSLNQQSLNCLSLLSKIYDQSMDFEKGFQTSQAYANLSDSIFNKEYRKKIDAIELTKKMETQLHNMQMSRQKSKERTTLIIILLVAVVIITVLLYSRSRALNKNISLENNLLNTKLEIRNKELTTRIMALIQRNEIEKEIIQQLNSLEPKIKKENRDEFGQIINALSFKQNDQLWKEFEVRFEGVHQDFFKRLTTGYQDLTVNEKRLCAFLYLDMSSKDISAITGQTTRALNVARTRLRKKFDITNTSQSLSSFLNNLP